MIKEKIYKTFSNTKPYIEKIVIDSAKGYTFGCLFGIFIPSKKSMLTSMHENGKNFAKISALYSSTELVLSKIRNKDDSFNSFTAGTIAGAIGSKHRNITSGFIFGTYSALSHCFNKKQK